MGANSGDAVVPPRTSPEGIPRGEANRTARSNDSDVGVVGYEAGIHGLDSRNRSAWLNGGVSDAKSA
jgi:hypothetical protein